MFISIRSTHHIYRGGSPAVPQLKSAEEASWTSIGKPPGSFSPKEKVEGVALVGRPVSPAPGHRLRPGSSHEGSFYNATCQSLWYVDLLHWWVLQSMWWLRGDASLDGTFASWIEGCDCPSFFGQKPALIKFYEDMWTSVIHYLMCKKRKLIHLFRYYWRSELVIIEHQYAIAFVVVEVESFVTWKWFLESLKADLQIDNTFPWTVMTDKQKVLYLFLMLISYNICHVVCCSNICHLSGFNPSSEGSVPWGRT